MWINTNEKQQLKQTLTLQRPGFFEGRKAGVGGGGVGYIDPPPAISLFLVQVKWKLVGACIIM